MTTTVLPLSVLDPCPEEENPNVMTVEETEALRLAIQRFGFRQPISVASPSKGRYAIIDGVHRVEAARALGMTEVPCDIIEEVLGRDEVIARRLSMNRNRGRIDLGIASMILHELRFDHSWSEADLSAVMPADELATLLAPPPTEPEAGGAGSGSASGPGDLPDRPHTLELAFADAKVLKVVQTKLRKASGDAKDVSTGLLHLLGLVES